MIAGHVPPRFIADCGDPRPGWNEEAWGSDPRGCVLPQFHDGWHTNEVGRQWEADPRLPYAGRLLYGATSAGLACRLVEVEGVFALPDTGILIVAPLGLLRLTRRDDGGPLHFYGGRVEICVAGHMLSLRPLLDQRVTAAG